MSGIWPHCQVALTRTCLHQYMQRDQCTRHIYANSTQSGWQTPSQQPQKHGTRSSPTHRCTTAAWVHTASSAAIANGVCRTVQFATCHKPSCMPQCRHSWLVTCHKRSYMHCRCVVQGISRGCMLATKHSTQQLPHTVQASAPMMRSRPRHSQPCPAQSICNSHSSHSLYTPSAAYSHLCLNF